MLEFDPFFAHEMFWGLGWDETLQPLWYTLDQFQVPHSCINIDMAAMFAGIPPPPKTPYEAKNLHVG